MNLPNIFPDPPLHRAARLGDRPALELLLAQGNNPDIRDHSNRTPLMQANSPEIVNLLIKAGADINAIDDYGKDALQILLEEIDYVTDSPQRLMTANALIQAGADLERRDPYGYTRLHRAVVNHADRAVAFLINLGANPQPDPVNGYTPLHLLCWQGEPHDPKQQKAVDYIVDLLVVAGVPVNAKDNRGNAPLHEAALGDRGNPTAMQALLGHGADPNIANAAGETPLMIAAGMGELECVRVLLAAGADSKSENREGKTATEYAQGNYIAWKQINEQAVANFGKSNGASKSIPLRHQVALERAIACLKLLQEAAT